MSTISIKDPRKQVTSQETVESPIWSMEGDPGTTKIAFSLRTNLHGRVVKGTWFYIHLWYKQKQTRSPKASSMASGGYCECQLRSLLNEMNVSQHRDSTPTFQDSSINFLRRDLVRWCGSLSSTERGESRFYQRCKQWRLTRPTVIDEMVPSSSYAFTKCVVMVKTNLPPRVVTLSLRAPMALADTINGRRRPDM